MKSKLSTIVVLSLFGYGAIANPTLTPGTWIDITPSALSLTGGSVTYDIQLDPNHPSTIYFNTTGRVAGGPLWKSTDGGSTWTNIGNFAGITAGVGFGRIKIDPNDSQHLYTCVEMGSNTAADGFWVSTDGGNNWTQPAGWKSMCGTITSGNFYDEYDLAVDPSDFNHALASSRSWVSQIAETTDGGTTWKSITISGANGNDYNIFFLSYPKLSIGNGSTWLVTCPAGIWRTTDAGNNWTKNNTSYQVMYHSGQYYSKTGALYMGGTPMPLRSTDNGVTWQQLTTGLSLFGTYWVIKGDGTTLYTAHTNVWSTPNNGPTQVSPESDGVGWTNYQPNGAAQQLANGPNAMAYDSTNHIMYSSNFTAILALKIPTPTGAKVDQSPTSRKIRDSVQLTLPKGSSRIVVQKARGVFYDVKGCHLGAR